MNTIDWINLQYSGYNSMKKSKISSSNYSDLEPILKCFMIYYKQKNRENDEKSCELLRIEIDRIKSNLKQINCKRYKKLEKYYSIE